MSSPEFQVVFGVPDFKVIKALKEVGIKIDREEFNLVDEGVFGGMYNGQGDCPEYLGVELNMLDEYEPFIFLPEIDYSNNETARTFHKSRYSEEVNKLLRWLEEEGYDGFENLELPEPTYFIACGTD